MLLISQLIALIVISTLLLSFISYSITDEKDSITKTTTRIGKNQLTPQKSPH